MDFVTKYDLDPHYKTNLFLAEYQKYVDNDNSALDSGIVSEFENGNLNDVREQLHAFLALPFVDEEAFWATRELLSYRTNRFHINSSTNIRVSPQFVKACLLLTALWMLNLGWVTSFDLPTWAIMLMVIGSFVLLTLLFGKRTLILSQRIGFAVDENEKYTYAIDLMDAYGRKHYPDIYTEEIEQES